MIYAFNLLIPSQKIIHLLKSLSHKLMAQNNKYSIPRVSWLPQIHQFPHPSCYSFFCSSLSRPLHSYSISTPSPTRSLSGPLPLLPSPSLSGPLPLLPSLEHCPHKFSGVMSLVSGHVRPTGYHLQILIIWIFGKAFQETIKILCSNFRNLNSYCTHKILGSFS